MGHRKLPLTADIRKTILTAYNMPIKAGKLDDISKLDSFEELDDTKNYRAGDMLALQLVADALNGDRTALGYVVKIMGIMDEGAHAQQFVKIEIDQELRSLAE